MKNASSLTMSPSNLNIMNEINIADEESTLTFTQGTNNNKITGDGTLIIKDVIVNNALIHDKKTIITQNSTLENNSTITGSIDNKGIITGSGELKLTGNSITENDIKNKMSLVYDTKNNQKATLTIGNSEGNVITLTNDIVSDNQELVSETICSLYLIISKFGKRLFINNIII